MLVPATGGAVPIREGSRQLYGAAPRASTGRSLPPALSVPKVEELSPRSARVPRDEEEESTEDERNETGRDEAEEFGREP